MTHLDLFSGIGGFALAAQACGYTTIGFCEKEPYAQQILKERFGAVLANAVPSEQWRESWKGKVKIHDDIFTLNGADYAGVDLLTGGFPCQPFSVAGKRRGAADDRALWPEMLRVIDGAKPTWLIGENVVGIVTMELDNILSDLEGIGYAAWPLVIPACAVDARHRRDRVWIAAHAIGLRESQSSRGVADKRGRTVNQGEDVADANLVGLLAGRHNAGESEITKPVNQCSFYTWPGEQDWFPQSPICRVAHGIPYRAHRLRGLGNAIVPQVAEEIIRAITMY